MANRTDTQADTVHGTNPQYLVDRIVRHKIYNDAYWKEYCFGLTTESLIDRAADLDYVGGTYGGRRRPAKFLCLFLKLLQIQPDEDVVLEYIQQPDMKYLRALGAAYLRISARPMTVHQTLEPLFADYRKLRYRDLAGKVSIIHMDEFIDWLLREESVCDVTMPQLPKREILEQSHDLPLRKSILDDDIEDLEDLEPADTAEPQKGDTGGASPPAQAAPGADSGSPQASRRRRTTESPSRRRSRGRSARGSPSRRRSRSARRPREERRRRSASASAARARSRSRSCSSEQRRREKQAAKDKKEKKAKHDKKDKKAGKEAKHRDCSAERAAPKGGAGGGRKGKDGEPTVEGWNQIRKDLGLKPLK